MCSASGRLLQPRSYGVYAVAACLHYRTKLPLQLLRCRLPGCEIVGGERVLHAEVLGDDVARGFCLPFPLRTARSKVIHRFQALL